MKIKKLNDLAHTPTRGSEQSAGWDLYAATSYDIIIQPGQTVKIGTGIAVEIPSDHFGGIYARSGLATKQGLAPANKVGVIDSDYRGELIVALHNSSDIDQVVTAGSRIAQLIIQPYTSVSLEEVNDLSDTDRGSGGFGSTGTK